jgi:hypothetical protein
MRNRKSNRPLDKKCEVHEQLVERYRVEVEKREKELADNAFEGFTFQPIANPTSDILEAVEDRDFVNLKNAALAAYETKNYSALRLASKFDDDIRELVEHLETYGDLADETQKIFLDFALAGPEK